MLTAKSPFEEFLLRFRQTRKEITSEFEIGVYSDKHNLDFSSDALPHVIYTYGSDGGNYIFKDRKIGFWTVLGNEQPASMLLSDIEWELAKWCYTEVYDGFFAPVITEEQRHYLNNLLTNLTDFKKCATDLREILEKDSDYNVDANDYIANKNRLPLSFDELEISINKWATEAIEKTAIATYEPKTDKLNPLHQAHLQHNNKTARADRLHHDVVKLSKAFSYAIREELSKEDLYKVVKNNAQTNDSSCATHDFCDANMVMHWSFGYVFQMELDLDKEGHTELVNAAWGMSKKANFEN